ncbi:MAG TPA: heme-binding domain-containing protein [Vicinamibacterales bacterium]|jgi:hypothetical protein|nr:heme-binding domain-containing protein [Vicinamibacterales bacterium]
MHRGVGLAAAAVVAAVAASAAFGPDRTNPAVDPTAALDVGSVPAPVVSVMREACFDCHSDETRWPWYASVPPVSLLVAHDVNKGRSHMNFSEWRTYNPFDRADMLDDACKRASSGDMPIWPYRLLHPKARLSAADITTLCDWTRTEADRLASGGD